MKQLPWSKIKRISFIAIFFLGVFIIFGQLIYPKDRALPLSKIDSQSVGGKSSNDLLLIISQKLNETRLVFRDQDYKKIVSLSDLSAQIPTEGVVNQMTDYSFLSRLIPLSIFFKGSGLDQMKLDLFSNDLEKILTEIAADRNMKAVDAELKIKDGAVMVTPSQNGQNLKINEIAEKVRKIDFKIGQDNEVRLLFDTVKPTHLESEFEMIKGQAESILAKPISMSLAGEIINIDPSVRAGFLGVDLTADNQIKLALNQANFSEFINRILLPKVYRAPVNTIVNKIDNIEVSRVLGASGIGIDSVDLTSKINAVLFSNYKDTNLLVKTSAIPAEETVNDTYSHTLVGLQAYYYQLNQQNSNTKIWFQQLAGSHWHASVGDSDSVVAASTYKLYVALMLSSNVNKGVVRWDDPFLSRTNASCFESMIVVSSNDCSEAWLKQWGRTEMNNFIYSKGISRATNFRDLTATKTSASDLAKVLSGLYYKTLFNESDANRLVELMKRQIYRGGIAKGSPSKVADKVGFLWDYINDAAIVYHPKGDYILVVMTIGETWSKIAEIARKTEEIVYL